jgi:hypothetical protein
MVDCSVTCACHPLDAKIKQFERSYRMNPTAGLSVMALFLNEIGSLPA